MKEENMDQVFRHKLESISEEPPAYIWDGIQERMAVAAKKRRLPWYSWSAAAALLALAFIAGWYFRENQESVVFPGAETGISRSQDDLMSPDDEVSSPGNQENSTIWVAVDTPAKTEQETNATAPVSGAPDEDDMPVMESRDSRQPVRSGMKAMDRIVAAQVSSSAPEQEKALALKSKTRSFPGLFADERDMRDLIAIHTEQVSDREGRWKMGLSVSPGYSSYRASHSNAYASNMTYEAAAGNQNLSGGISLQFKAGKRWSVESGVYYAQNGQETSSSPHLSASRMEADYAASSADGKFYFNTPVTMTGDHIGMNSTAGIIEFETLPGNAEIAASPEAVQTYARPLLIQGELSQVFDFVEIPLYMRYVLIDSKIDVDLIGGVNAGLIVGNNVYIDNEFGVQHIGKTRDISSVNVSGTLGFGLTYALGRHFSLAVEPRMNYYMNSINRNPDVEFHPYRVGVYTGLYYAF